MSSFQKAFFRGRDFIFFLLKVIPLFLVTDPPKRLSKERVLLANEKKPLGRENNVCVGRMDVCPPPSGELGDILQLIPPLEKS